MSSKRPTSREICGRIMECADTVGAIVITLDGSGNIDVGMFAAPDTEASQPILDMFSKIRAHCDENHAPAVYDNPTQRPN